MRIALDFDGVMSHTMNSWCVEANKLLGTNYSIRDIKQWEFFNDFGMPMDKAFEIFDLAWSKPDMLLPLEQDLWQKTKMLNNIGTVDIVSAVPEKHKESIAIWLQKHGIRYNDLILTQKKCDLDYGVFIDDSPSNAQKLEKQNKNLLLYNQPWNRHLHDNLYRKRIYNLYHAIDVLKNG